MMRRLKFDMRTLIGRLELRYLLAALVYALANIISPADVLASFEQNSVTARSAGMSDAVSATVDDASALYYNPAGIVRVRRPEVASTYSRLFYGLSDKSQITRSFVGYAQPLNEGSALGVDYINLSLGGLYSEDTVGLSYARVWREQLNIGGTLKLLRRGFGSDSYTDNAINVESGDVLGGKDPVFNSGRSKTAFGLDLGTQYTFSNYYRVGLSLKNINQPNVGLSSTDKAPAAYSLGIGRKVRNNSFALEETMSKYGGAQNQRFSGGGEHWFLNGLGIRAGFGFGSRGYTGMSAGAGYRMDGFQFDYGINYPLKGVESAGTHLVSLTFRFGKPLKDPLEERLDQEHKGRLKAENEVVRLKKKLEELMARVPVEPPPMQPEQNAKPVPHQMAVPKSGATNGTPDAAQNVPHKPHVTIPPGVLAAYTETLKYFAYQVKSGAPIAERIATLKQILETYKRSGIDMGSIQTELAKLQNESSRVADDYVLASGYYRKIVQQGTSVDERLILLDRIIKKYRPFGVDTSALERELEDLRKEKH